MPDDDRPARDQSTAIEVVEPHVGRRCVLVIGDGIFASHVLPDSGTVRIGRAPENDVPIDHPSISRKHAVLHVGPLLTIEDLDSANGTKVRDARLTSGQIVPIRMGEVIELGSAMIIIQERSVAVRPRRLWTHGYFEARLEEECARAERDVANFAVVRVHCGEAASSTKIEQALFASLRSVDVLGTYGPHEYEMILIDSAASEADEAIARLRQAMADADPGELRFGVAIYPDHGRDADSLMAAASAALRGPVDVGRSDAELVVSGAMHQLQRLVERIAQGNISVLILGETGVGKEVLAERVHRLSPRDGKPFLCLNCAALSESLLESELFGHERGAFTGAVREKLGLLESADGGTVFLDEIGELPMTIQVKLLRVLEERRTQRVGALRPRDIDIRFVAATNRDLELEIGRGMFRQDLYFRLAGITLSVPPLRERVDEIPGLVEAFVADASRGMRRSRLPSVSADAMTILRRYQWPGNIRELRNVIERAVLLCSGDELTRHHLPLEKMAATQPGPTPGPRSPLTPADGAPAPRAPALVRATGAAPAGDTTSDAALERVKREMWELERQRVVDALNQHAGNQTRAARSLGISRRTLLKRLDAYALPRPRKD